MPKMDSEHVDTQQVRSMAARLADYVGQLEKYATDMESNGVEHIEAKNSSSFDRALRELSRTVSGLFLGFQGSLNQRVRTIPTRKPRKAAGTTGLLSSRHHAPAVLVA